jgi:hypothetical protein
MELVSYLAQELTICFITIALYPTCTRVIETAFSYQSIALYPIHVMKTRVIGDMTVLASHLNNTGSVPGDFKWHSCCTEWHWSSVFSEFFSFPPLIIIPPLLHTHLSPPHAVCDSPDQATHYHTLGPMLGASSLTRHLAGLGVKVVYFFIFYGTRRFIIVFITARQWDGSIQYKPSHLFH